MINLTPKECGLENELQIFSSLIILQLIDLVMLPDLLVSLGFDLADALAGDAELAAYLLEGMGDAVIQSVAHLEDLALFLGKITQDHVDLIAENAAGRLLVRREDLVVGDEILQSRLAVVAIVADWALERDDVLLDLLDLIDLIYVHIHLHSDLFG